MPPAHWLISVSDFNNWPETKDWPEAKIHARGRKALLANEGAEWLDDFQVERWRRGDLTPWLRDERRELIEHPSNQPACKPRLDSPV